jgi:hypothetical protein
VGAFEGTSGIEDITDSEVLKLHPDARSPRFLVGRHDTRRLMRVQRSPRCCEDLAESLIHNRLAHHENEGSVVHVDVRLGACATAVHPEPAEPGPTGKDRSTCNILMVADDLVSRTMAMGVLDKTCVWPPCAKNWSI